MVLSPPGAVKGCSLSPPHPDQLWGPSSLLVIGYQGLFPGSKVVGGLILTTHVHLVSRLIIRGGMLPFPICLQFYIFMPQYLVKHRDNFTFTFINCDLVLQMSFMFD